MDQSKLVELEKFFSAEYFTPEMLLQYLFKHKDNQEVLEILLKTLRKWADQTLSLYAPQLCCLLIRFELSQIQKYFVQKSSESIAMYFNLYWAFSAYSQLEKKQQKLNKLDKILRLMEMGMVNGQSEESNLDGKGQEEAQQYLLQQYQLKEQKSNYNTDVQKFFGTLIRFSISLKQFDQEERKHHLGLFIRKANQAFSKLQDTSFRGIHAPSLSFNDDKPNSNTIVAIVEKGYVCFHTKKRVPYLLLVETIDPADLEKFRLEKQEKSASLEVEGFVEQSLNDPKFERQMAKIESDEQQIYHDALNKIMKMEHKHKRQSEIWLSVDRIVNKQSQICNNKNNEKAQAAEKKERRKSLSDCLPSEQMHARATSLEKNEAKSDQFLQYLQKTLPQNKQQFLKKFRNKPKQRLWEVSWNEKIKKYAALSRFAKLPSFKIRPIIIKGGDDLRQEMFAIQMIRWFNKIFESADLKLYMRPYNILITSANSGILEYIPNTMSIDSLKKKFGNGTKSLIQIYREIFGNQFEEAQKNFIESLASYSLFTYLMQVKDRHNGNILIDDRGHIIHIDFGFILQTSPGGVNFESAPFKLTYEYVELMKGKDSDFFGYFRTLMIKGLLELKKYVQDFAALLQIMIESSELPCFQNLDLKQWVARFSQSSTDKECMDLVDKLIQNSLYSWRTAQYDNFQKRTNGILL